MIDNLLMLYEGSDSEVLEDLRNGIATVRSRLIGRDSEEREMAAANSSSSSCVREEPGGIYTVLYLV